MHRVRIPFAGVTKFIEAVFEIEEKDRKKIEERFGQGVLASNLVAFKRDFSGILYWKIDYNEKIAVQRIVSDLHLANGSNNFSDLIKYAEELSSNDNDKDIKVSQLIMTRVNSVLEDSTFDEALFKYIWQLTPKIFYYDEYSNLPYSVKIEHLLKTPEETPNI